MRAARARVARALLASLPLPVLYALFGTLACIVRSVLRSAVHRGARQSSRGCFPGAGALREVERIARAHYRTGRRDGRRGRSQAARLSPEELAARMSRCATSNCRALLLAQQASRCCWWPRTRPTGSGCCRRWRCSWDIRSTWATSRSAAPWAERAMNATSARASARTWCRRRNCCRICCERRQHRARHRDAGRPGAPTSDHQHWADLPRARHGVLHGAGTDGAGHALRGGVRRLAANASRPLRSRVHAAGAAGEQLAPGEFTSALRATGREARSARRPADWTWGHRRWKLKRGRLRRLTQLAPTRCFASSRHRRMIEELGEIDHVRDSRDRSARGSR